MQKSLIPCLLIMLSLTTRAQQELPLPEIKIEVERLPDLNIPRAGHETFIVNGEYTVVGGHTNGFVPTPTAEYFKDGQWHLMQMFYNHDFGTTLVLKSGKVLLAGGVKEDIGVGQTFTAELYDPITHTFDGFGSMNIKRAKASALELDSGKVVVAGNWYQIDGIELFDGQKSFSYIKDVTIPSAYPYIFRIAKDDALILGCQDNKGKRLTPPVAVRLKGDTVHIPLLETWHPFFEPRQFSTVSFIGNKEQGVYAYLMPVEDESGQVAIMKVENGRFSLLPTVCPVPMRSKFGYIWYCKDIVVDRQARRAYLMGANADLRTADEEGYRYYVLAIDYAQASDDQPAPLTLYYTDPQPVFFDNIPIVTADGHLLLAGGMIDNSYFKTSNAIILLHVGKNQGENHGKATDRRVSGNPVPLILLLILGGAILICVLLFLFIKHRRKQEASKEPAASGQQAPDAALMSRICELMESQKLYLNSDLKIADVATALGSNRYYISDCINTNRGCSFNQFVNNYRIEYARQLLRTHPDIKISELWMLSGFSTERTFLRAFKIVTGMTPSEYKGKND